MKKASRGRPRETIDQRRKRFYSDANKVAAQLAENYVRTFFQGNQLDGSLKPVTHKNAVRYAIEDLAYHGWTFPLRNGKPQVADPKRVLDLLRRRRTDVDENVVEVRIGRKTSPNK
jgi:hypothetical protein